MPLHKGNTASAERVLKGIFARLDGGGRKIAEGGPAKAGKACQVRDKASRVHIWLLSHFVKRGFMPTSVTTTNEHDASSAFFEDEHEDDDEDDSWRLREKPLSGAR